MMAGDYTDNSEVLEFFKQGNFDVPLTVADWPIKREIGRASCRERV